MCTILIPKSTTVLQIQNGKITCISVKSHIPSYLDSLTFAISMASIHQAKWIAYTCFSTIVSVVRRCRDRYSCAWQVACELLVSAMSHRNGACTKLFKFKCSCLIGRVASCNITLCICALSTSPFGLELHACIREAPSSFDRIALSFSRVCCHLIASQQAMLKWDCYHLPRVKWLEKQIILQISLAGMLQLQKWGTKI